MYYTLLDAFLAFISVFLIEVQLTYSIVLVSGIHYCVGFRYTDIQIQLYMCVYIYVYVYLYFCFFS